MIFALVVLAVAASIEAQGPDSLTVTGQLRCRDGAGQKVHVRLYDEDIGNDDTMEEKTITLDKSGSATFSLSNVKKATDPLGRINPYIKIYHNCNDKIVLGLCQRRFKAQIPQKFLSGTLDIGLVALDLVIDKEEKDCSVLRLFNGK